MFQSFKVSTLQRLKPQGLNVGLSLFQLVQPIIVTIQAMLVHFCNPQESSRTFSHFGHQCAQAIDLTIVFLRFERQ